MTLLCVPILTDTAEEALAAARAAKDAGADLVELRVDRLFSGASPDLEDQREADAIAALVRDAPLPVLLTCRPTWEGGEYDGDDAARVALFEFVTASDHPPAYIDAELAAYTRSDNIKQKLNLCVAHEGQQRDVSTRLVLSLHDFDRRPADLLRRVGAMRSAGAAAVHKVAYRARSVRDNLELFDLLGERDRPTIALAMGEFGLASRVLAPKFGGFLTFASLTDESATAPGQPTVDELLNLYRFRSIDKETRVFAILGDPVGHSLSPHVHNAGFGAASENAVYLPLRIPGEWEHFKATLSALTDHAELDFAGASVTIPHKEHLLRFALERIEAGDEAWSVDDSAKRAGAANTLALREGGWFVTNTDAPAATGCFLDRFPEGLAGKRVVVLGAGGAARALAWGCAAEGAHVSVCARRPEEAQRLAKELTAHEPAGRIDTLDWDERNALQANATPHTTPHTAPHAIVNCTPVGMRGGGGGKNPDALPLEQATIDGLDDGAVVFDTVYNPLETPLLRAARARGLRVIDGAAFFVRQAEAQFELWTGKRPSVGLFSRVVLEKLAPGGAVNA